MQSRGSEQKNTTKYWQAIVNGAEQMVEAFKHFANPPPNAVNVSNIIEEIMAVMKT